MWSGKGNPMSSTSPKLNGRILAWSAAAAMLALAPAATQAQAPSAEAVLDQYYTMRDAEPDRAFAYLLENEAAHGDEIRVQLELAYYLIERERNAEALPYLERASSLDPARAEIWTQLGYVRVALDRDEDALTAFDRSLALSPNDEVALQRAYLLQKLGRNRAAAESFHDLSGSGQPDIADQSCDAYENLYNVADKAFDPPFFGETYFAPEYNSHWELGVIPFQGRVGAVIEDTHEVEAYLGLRASVDTRSGNGPFGTQIYNDNAAVIAAGLRARPIPDVPLSLFIEAGTAYDITDRNRDRWRGDVRGGFLFYDEWNMAPACGERKGGVRPVADFYADGIYFSRYDDNVLFFFRARPGLRLSETENHAIDLYLHGAAGFDTSGVNYNNFEELGAGIGLKFYKPAGLTIRGEGVRVFRHDGLSSYSTFRIRLEHQIRF
jgi:tetratricopeptide (TPR) repeat protein